MIGDLGACRPSQVKSGEEGEKEEEEEANRRRELLPLLRGVKE